MGIRGNDNADVMRRGYRARQPAYDIDQSVSLDVNLVSLNINYYCLFDTSQSPRRKHYVRVCRDNHDNPGTFVKIHLGCRLSRVTKTERIDIRYASFVTDNDICVISRRICNERVKRLI